jgi:hypothetical protein
MIICFYFLSLFVPFYLFLLFSYLATFFHISTCYSLFSTLDSHVYVLYIFITLNYLLTASSIVSSFFSCVMCLCVYAYINTFVSVCVNLRLRMCVCLCVDKIMETLRNCGEKPVGYIERTSVGNTECSSGCLVFSVVLVPVHY